jgi:hypothetical protein
MSQPEQVEVLILGSGEGGKKMAWHMARSGRRTAVGREEVDRGLPSQYRLPPQQKRDLEREGRASGASRRPVRHDDQRSCHDRHGKGPPA